MESHVTSGDVATHFCFTCGKGIHCTMGKRCAAQDHFCSQACLDDRDDLPNGWIGRGTRLEIIGEDFTEEVTVIDFERRLRDGTMVGVRTEGDGCDTYTCDISPSGLATYEGGPIFQVFPTEE